VSGGASLDDVLARIDDLRLFALLETAVAEYSPPYAEEPAMRVFADALAEAGIPHIRQSVKGRAHGDAPGNLIVEFGPQPPALLWVGHVDTVPVIDEEQLTPRREGDLLFGLGTADMKSGCAAVVEALTALTEAGAVPKRGAAVALVVGEEEYGDGSEALIERMTAPLTVIGEPTGLVPCLDHFGYHEYRLTTRGRQVHAALPELGASAIHAMLAWITAMYEAASGPDYFDRIAFNPREIRGGGNLFIVAPECEASLDIHTAPGVGAGDVATLVERGRAVAAADHAECSFESDAFYAADGYEVDGADARIAPLRRAFERGGQIWQPGAFRSHSDGNMFHAAGAAPIICGPGKLEVAHTRDEHVSLAETALAARIYTRLIWEACCS
jgi:acetylornithine deacetylase